MIDKEIIKGLTEVIESQRQANDALLKRLIKLENPLVVIHDCVDKIKGTDRFVIPQEAYDRVRDEVLDEVIENFEGLCRIYFASESDKFIFRYCLDVVKDMKGKQ